MASVREQDGQDLLLDGWAGRVPRRDARRLPDAGDRGGLRFAFYGRTSTVEHQDRFTSCSWQREAAELLIAGSGVIVQEFFDVGCSRRLSWWERPQAAALLAALQAVDRPFDAVVVGEYERAFSGDQFTTVTVVFNRCGVQVWLPEAGGPVDVGSATHRALVTVLGAQSQREVLRSRHRVLAAMQAQVSDQGRYLGGRPPYGYRLVDGGPHPNRAHAQWGRRLRRLDPDLATAPHVRWMFEQRLAGCSVASIARELNERGVPCPSDVDPERNRHRTGEAWTLRTVAVILANPRYTGRQVWNRQSTVHAGRGMPAHRTNPSDAWVISKTVAHPALVTESEFVVAQQIRAARPTKDGSVRHYLLAGMVQCRLCGRRMDSHWVNGRAGYRCRHGHNSTRRRTFEQPKNSYVREDALLAQLAAWFASYPDSHGLDGRPGVRDLSDAASIVAYLRDGAMVIVYDGNNWNLATAG